MKINNETKIGIIGVITVVLFVLGFNFLKGKRIFSNTLILYAKFQDIQGLATSNPVIIKGLEVGHKVLEVGTDYVLLEDAGGVTETMIPVTSIRSVVRLRE